MCIDEIMDILFTQHAQKKSRSASGLYRDEKYNMNFVADKNENNEFNEIEVGELEKNQNEKQQKSGDVTP